MPSFGKASLKQLQTLHPDLQRLLNEAIKYFDFSIVEGFRNKEAQNRAYAKGLSDKKWPNGKHNKKPSLAVDIAPYPIDWSDERRATERFVLLAGFVLCLASQLGLNIRWGGDWDQDEDTRNEQGLRDYPHFELVL